MIRRIPRSRHRRWRRGRTDLAGLLGLHPDACADLLRYAHEALAEGRPDAAEPLFGLAATLAPGASDPAARLGLAACRQLLGDLDGAIRGYDAVIADHPDDPYARTNRAECHLLAGRREAARTDLDAARTLVDRGDTGADLRERVCALDALAAGGEGRPAPAGDGP